MKTETKIERETMLLPEVIADNVVGELERFLGGGLLGAREHLAEFAETVYANNDNFRRLLRSRSNRGRDSLYAFMRHWLTAWVGENRPTQLSRIPRHYYVGGELHA